MDPNDYCPRCMRRIGRDQDPCPFCGYIPFAGYAIRPQWLPLHSILKGRYLLGTALGEGGFGITYAGLDLRSEPPRRVAVKELFPAGEVLRRDCEVIPLPGREDRLKQCRQKFDTEAAILHRFRELPGIVTILDYFAENGTAYIVMEYLDGMDLRSFLLERGKPLSFEETFILLRPMLKSLHELHTLGVFHRDISPDNIRVLPNGEVKLMDFGGAKYNYAGEEPSRIVLVKHGYAPREQYSRNYRIGPWMDVYGAGATFYRCITGKAPREAVQRKDDGDIERPSQISGLLITPAQEEVLLKALAVRIEDRYASMKEFYDALKASLGYVSIDAGMGKCNGKAGGETKDYQELVRELNDSPRDVKGLILGCALSLLFALLIALARLYLNAWGNF